MGVVKPTGELTVVKIPGEVRRITSGETGISRESAQVALTDGDSATSVEEACLDARRWDDTNEAIRVAAHPRRTVTADAHDDGSLTQILTGEPAHGEGNTQRVLDRLVERLNRDGANWERATIPSREEGVDGYAVDGQLMLRIQVTKATAAEDIWRDLNTGRSSLRFAAADDAADALKVPIERKSRKLASKGDVLLGLDAVDATVFAMRQVVSSFWRRHSGWARQQGFAAVWIVGPVVDLVTRLDEIPPTDD